MPTYGICGPLSIAAAVKAAGGDYLECSVQTLLQGDTADADWTGHTLIAGCALPVEAANLLLPPDLPIVGPTVDRPRLDRYLSRIFPRAKACGIDTLVFGAGRSRTIPDGFDREAAKAQIVDFLMYAGRCAADAGVTLVIEPLHRGECNILNTVQEAAAFAAIADAPSVRCLVDSYHFWTEHEPLAHLAAAMPTIAHVHVADEHGRLAPGRAAIASDYRSFFKTLKAGGYDGRISVEAREVEAALAETLAFLRHEWDAA